MSCGSEMCRDSHIYNINMQFSFYFGEINAKTIMKNHFDDDKQIL